MFILLLLCLQGDAVGAWAGDNLAAVLFPTADTIKQLRQLAERQPKAPELLLIFNPQWELQVRRSSCFDCCSFSCSCSGSTTDSSGSSSGGN
jgi:hypothetical protein